MLRTQKMPKEEDANQPSKVFTEVEQDVTRNVIQATQKEIKKPLKHRQKITTKT